jgi:hypothetical protein
MVQNEQENFEKTGQKAQNKVGRLCNYVIPLKFGMIIK